MELADADIKEGSDFNTKSDKVIPVSGEVEPIPTYAEDLYILSNNCFQPDLTVFNIDQ